jgi:hypothetical protein
MGTAAVIIVLGAAAVFWGDNPYFNAFGWLLILIGIFMGGLLRNTK